MAYKNRLLLTMAAAMLAAGITATAFAAPGNFSVQADELEYDLGSGEAVAKGNTDLGIAICGSGIGISIACNKVKGIRCAKVSNKQEAKYTRNDNDANIIALSAEVPEEEALEIITTFINTPFSNEERHIRRINKIKEYEEKHEW